MNRQIARQAFFAIERLRGERVDLYLPEMERNQFLPGEELASLQRSKLLALLEHAQRHSPYYAEKYEGLQAAEAFHTLPLLTKAQLRENYTRIVTPDARSKVQLCKTSGSTGEPLKFYRDGQVFGRTLASVYRAHRWYGIDVGAKEAMLWGIPPGRLNRMKMRARDFALNRFRERKYSLDPQVLQDFYEAVRTRRPEYLFGYSSMVYEFAVFVRERSLPTDDLGLKGAVCTAESIPDYQRDEIQSVLRCPVIGEYGSAETGIISYQCPQGGHHISADAVLVEILDDDGAPVPVGTVGRVVVTVLHSQAAPIIRYDLGDYAAFASTSCPCGRSLPLLDRIVGRTSGVIVTPSGRCFHSIAMYYIMKDYADQFGGVRQFRVRQTQIDKLEFHIAASSDFTDAARAWLERTVHSTFGEAMGVEFFIRESIERSASGKLKDFESLLDMNDNLIKSFRAKAHVEFNSPSSR